MTSTLGTLIREARERAGLSEVDLARVARTSPGAIPKYEAGEVVPTLETARRCIEACGFEFRIELTHASPQRRAAADAALARSVEDRLRTNDAFTRLAAQLRSPS